MAAVVSGVTTALDLAFMRPLKKPLETIGVSKKLCEAATSLVGQMLADATTAIDEVSKKFT